MISGFLETRLLPDDHLQKDLSGHRVPKPKPARRIKGVPTGSGQDSMILITTVLRSAHTQFITSHISSILREADVTPLQVTTCTTSAHGLEGNSCIQCSSGSEMTQVPQDGHILTALRCFLLHTFQCLFSVLQIWKLGYRADSI